MTPPVIPSGDRVDQLPFDAHMLVSLIAPRPLLLQTGDTDFWSDPKGEYLAAVAASPVWRLLGTEGLAIDRYPAAGEPVLSRLGYYMHAGRHGILPQTGRCSWRTCGSTSPRNSESMPRVHLVRDARPQSWRRMTETWRMTTMDDGVARFTRDAGTTSADRRGPNRPQGDSRLPAHIMAAVRETVRAAAATCVDPSRLEASGPYEWLAIVEAHDRDLSSLLRSYIEASRYLDELQHHTIDLGRIRLADAVRDATFARDSMKRSLDEEIGRRRRAD